MNRAIRIIVVLLVAPIVPLPRAGVARCDDSAKEAFLREYKPSPSFLRQCERGHQYTIELTGYHPGRRRIEEVEGVANMTGFYIRETVIRTMRDDGTSTETDVGQVELGNGAYLAMIKKTSAGYALSTLDVFPGPRRMTASLFYCCLVEPHLHDTYSNVVSNDLARVLDYSGQTIDGRPLKRLRLVLEASYPGVGKVSMTNDYFFDPESDWHCVRMRNHGRSQDRMQERVYQEQVIELADRAKNWGGFPERIINRDVDEDRGTNTITRTYQTKVLVQRTVEPEEMRLTHFGLPEPQGVVFPKRGVPLYVWLLGGSLALALLAIVMRAIAKRYRAPAVRKP